MQLPFTNQTAGMVNFQIHPAKRLVTSEILGPITVGMFCYSSNEGNFYFYDFLIGAIILPASAGHGEMTY